MTWLIIGVWLAGIPVSAFILKLNDDDEREIVAFSIIWPMLAFLMLVIALTTPALHLAEKMKAKKEKGKSHR